MLQFIKMLKVKGRVVNEKKFNYNIIISTPVKNENEKIKIQDN